MESVEDGMESMEALHGIKPKERCTQTAMPYANGDSMHPAGDSMSILRIE